MDIGFIGLGIMGHPMAGHLQAAGHNIVTAIHERQPPADLVEGGLIVLEKLMDVAKKTEVVIAMVPNTQDVDEVLFGPEGLIEGLSNGMLFIDMSSICPMETRRFASRLEDFGCGYLDAPVSGGDVGAKAGSLSIMVGGSEGNFERAYPLFALMGETITHVGDVGSGQICKIANQIVVALNIEACAEALIYASKAGANPEKVRDALMGGFAASRVLEIHGERMIRRDFSAGARIGLHQKDLDLALEGAKALAITLPNTSIAQELFNACMANGGRDWDHSGMVRALEMLANHNIR